MLVESPDGSRALLGRSAKSTPGGGGETGHEEVGGLVGMAYVDIYSFTAGNYKE